MSLQKHFVILYTKYTPLITPCDKDACGYSAGMIKRHWHVLGIPQCVVRFKYEHDAAIIASVLT